MKVITTINGNGVSMNEGPPVNFSTSIQTNVNTLNARLKIAQPPKTYIGFAAARSRNFTTTRSSRTFTTRSRPYFELPVLRGVMIDDNFADFRSVPGRIDRKEPVHFTVKPDALHHMALICLERASEIMKLDPGNERNQFVGENARDIAVDIVVLPIFPPTGNDIHPVVKCVEHVREYLPDHFAHRRPAE